MNTKKILMASPNDWQSPFQVGSQCLARGFVRAGWKVAYLSDPISPWHIMKGWTADFARRCRTWRDGGCEHLDARLWTYLPLAALTPHRWPILRSKCVHGNWHRWTYPDVARKVRDRGFGAVDLLYMDSFSQSFWLEAIQYRQSVLRVADYGPFSEKYTAATRKREEQTAQRVDLVVYPSLALRPYVEGLGAKRALYLPNGVEFESFALPAPPPPEYLSLRKPIAVYVGTILEWFHFAWIREAARRLPAMNFCLIGPDRLARRELGSLANVHLFGPRPYPSLPGYLQHADVGLMPFNADRDPGAVECLNPLKLYQYLASGLPVVSSDWQALRELNPPVERCSTLAAFVSALERAPRTRGEAGARRDYAARFDWNSRVRSLLEALDGLRAAA